MSIKINSDKLLPLCVIHAAKVGKPEAIEIVLKHYEGYINKLCVRKLYHSNGELYYDIDEYMKSRIQNKLIREIVTSK